MQVEQDLFYKRSHERLNHVFIFTEATVSCSCVAVNRQAHRSLFRIPLRQSPNLWTLISATSHIRRVSFLRCAFFEPCNSSKTTRLPVELEICYFLVLSSAHRIRNVENQGLDN